MKEGAKDTLEDEVKAVKGKETAGQLTEEESEVEDVTPDGRHGGSVTSGKTLERVREFGGFLWLALYKLLIYVHRPLRIFCSVMIEKHGEPRDESSSRDAPLSDLAYQWHQNPWNHAISCLASQERWSDYHIRKQLAKFAHIDMDLSSNANGNGHSGSPSFAQAMKSLLERQLVYNDGLSRGHYDVEWQDLDEHAGQINKDEAVLPDEGSQEYEPFEGDPSPMGHLAHDRDGDDEESVSGPEQHLCGHKHTLEDSVMDGADGHRGRPLTTRSRLHRHGSHSYEPDHNTKALRTFSHSDQAPAPCIAPRHESLAAVQDTAELDTCTPTKTSTSHPLNISSLVPPELLTAIASHMSTRSDRLPPILDNSVDLWHETRGHLPKPRPTATDLDRIVAEDKASHLKHKAKGPQFGNAVLSSCPGKKVRLDGPVRGRGSVNRNLHSDLERAVRYGNGSSDEPRGQVKCIVCCLCDEELGLLGAPWEEYESSTSKLGIEVIRVPILEGSVPDNVTVIHDVLTHIISKYTVHGHSILFHCRGGVGRAGLVACCWMLRCGLIACLSNLVHILVQDKHALTKDERTQELRELIIRVVAQTIGVARRRRSIKAIETVSQVNFLIEYVKYLAQAQASLAKG